MFVFFAVQETGTALSKKAFPLSLLCLCVSRTYFKLKSKFKDSKSVHIYLLHKTDWRTHWGASVLCLLWYVDYNLQRLCKSTTPPEFLDLNNNSMLLFMTLKPAVTMMTFNFPFDNTFSLLCIKASPGWHILLKKLQMWSILFQIFELCQATQWAVLIWLPGCMLIT